MKKILAIAFAAVLAVLAISCQKENFPTGQNDEPVQYTFNISVNDQFGFDSDASTKGGLSPTYKTGWEDGDRIFLFFKPASGSLLEDTYATLTYNGSTWNGGVSGSSSLGEEGTLSAVYVYKLDSSAEPEFSDSQWTVETGNTFYNCEAGVSYTVSGNNEISASLSLEAPADFVRFTVYGTADKPLTCDKVEGWKDVAIGADMTFSNATCTGYIEGIENVGNSMHKDFFGRIDGGGTSLKGVSCNFWMEVNGKLYKRTAAPTTDAKSFSMAITTGSNPWTEVPATWGFAKAKKGEGYVYVKWIQLWENGPKFAEYNVGTTAEKNYGAYFEWTENIASTEWGDNWRMPTADEYQALLDKCHIYSKVIKGVKGYMFTGEEGSAYASNSVFFPAGGSSDGLDGLNDTGSYWASTPSSDDGKAKLLYFQLFNSYYLVDGDWCTNRYNVRAVLNEAPAVPDGALAGVFSVSDTKKVYFSKGNLWADGSEALHFESNQYSSAGKLDESHVSYFTWSDNVATAVGKNSSGSSLFCDENHKVAVNGSEVIYYALSKDEWTYLFNNHSYKWATVNEVSGYVIAPDGFGGNLSDTYADDAALVADNLVFLPAAGFRGNRGYDPNISRYWSSAAFGSDGAYYVDLNKDGVGFGDYVSRINGYSVRLITDVTE